MRQELILSVLPPKRSAGGAASVAEAVQKAFSRAFYQLEPLVGRHGTQALFARTIHLARPTYPWLSAVDAAPSVDPFATLVQEFVERAPEEALSAASSLLNIFADLLTSLIGEPLTNRLLRSAWNIPPVSAEPSEEKAK